MPRKHTSSLGYHLLGYHLAFNLAYNITLLTAVSCLIAASTSGCSKVKLSRTHSTLATATRSGGAPSSLNVQPQFKKNLTQQTLKEIFSRVRNSHLPPDQAAKVLQPLVPMITHDNLNIDDLKSGELNADYLSDFNSEDSSAAPDPSSAPPLSSGSSLSLSNFQDRQADVSDFVRGILSVGPEYEQQLMLAIMTKGAFAAPSLGSPSLAAPSVTSTAQKMLPGAGMKPSSSANINDLFQLLGVQQANLQKDLSFDAILIRYLVMKMIGFEQSQKRSIAAFLTHGPIAPFIKARFTSQVLKAKANTRSQVTSDLASSLLNIYGEVRFLAPDLEWLDVVHHIDLQDNLQENHQGNHQDNHPDENHELTWLMHIASRDKLMSSGTQFLYLLQNHMMATDSPKSTEFIADTLTSAVQLTKDLRGGLALRVETFNWLSVFYSFVDWQSQRLTSFDAAVRLLDEREQITRQISEIVEHRYQDYLAINGRLTQLHPRLRVALDQTENRTTIINHATIESRKSQVGDSLSSYISGMFRSITQARTGIKLDPPSSISLIAAKLGSTKSDLEQLSTADRIHTYQSALEYVVIGRHYLSNRGSLSNSSDTLDDYRSVRTILQLALCTRYLERLNGKDCETITQARGRERQASGSHEPIRNLSKEVETPFGRMAITIKGEKFVEPGIYFSESDVLIQADRLVFHPLAMIYTQGFDLRLEANDARDIWIDSSGADQIHENLNPPIDGIASKPDGSRGRTPSTPIAAARGLNAGKIEIAVAKVDGLISAFGGNGENGFPGAASPNCIDGVYKSAVHSWITSERVPNDCRKCYPQVCTSTPFGEVCTPRIDICRNDGNRGTMCGWHNNDEKHSETLHVDAGRGGDGGSGGDAGQITLSGSSRSDLLTILIAGGSPGLPGQAASCGPNAASGEGGTKGKSSRFTLLNPDVANQSMVTQ
jgi:hypothetical protein